MKPQTKLDQLLQNFMKNHPDYKSYSITRTWSGREHYDSIPRDKNPKWTGIYKFSDGDWFVLILAHGEKLTNKDDTYAIRSMRYER